MDNTWPVKICTSVRLKISEDINTGKALARTSLGAGEDSTVSFYMYLHIWASSPARNSMSTTAKKNMSNHERFRATCCFSVSRCFALNWGLPKMGQSSIYRWDVPYVSIPKQSFWVCSPVGNLPKWGKTVLEKRCPKPFEPQDEVMEIQKQWQCEAMRCSAAGGTTGVVSVDLRAGCSIVTRVNDNSWYLMVIVNLLLVVYD